MRDAAPRCGAIRDAFAADTGSRHSARPAARRTAWAIAAGARFASTTTKSAARIASACAAMCSGVRDSAAAISDTAETTRPEEITATYTLVRLGIRVIPDT